LLDGSVTTNAPFEGFYIFDSPKSDSNADPTVGDYQYSTSTNGLIIKVGTYVFRTNPRNVNFLIEVVNRTKDDHYLLRSYNNVCSKPLYVQHMSWQLDDSTGTALASDALPITPPDLTRFTNSPFGLTIDGGSMGGMPYLIRGRVQAISEAPAVIPERPSITLGQAVVASWPSSLGYFYQIQSSQDNQTWTDIGEPILGDGTVLSAFFAQQTSQSFYRAVIKNF